MGMARRKCCRMGQQPSARVLGWSGHALESLPETGQEVRELPPGIFSAGRNHFCHSLF